MKIPRSAQLAVGFVVIVVLLALLAWGFSALLGGQSDTSGQGDGQGIFGSLFPFGTPRIIENIIGGFGDEEEQEGVAPRVRHVTEQKVAGATFVTGIQGMRSIRYVERETGHIYETPVELLSQVRLTNTTVPRVQDALWVNASTTLLRFAADDGEVENFEAKISTSSVDQVLSGTFLKNYTRIVPVSTDRYLGVIESAESATVQVIEKGVSSTILTSPIRSWVPLSAQGKLFLMSAPAFGALGSLFEIRQGELYQIGESANGMTASISPSGKYALTSVPAGKSSIVSLIFELGTNRSTVLPILAFTEKCAWVKNLEPLLVCAVPEELPIARYPNDWLLGRVHTKDTLWFFNPDTGSATIAVDLPAEIDAPLDVSKLAVSDDGLFAIFIDRNDSSLWSAALTHPQ